MSNKTIDTMRQSANVLRGRVEQLESEAFQLRADAAAAREAEQLARKAAGDAWALVKSLRGAPYRA